MYTSGVSEALISKINADARTFVVQLRRDGRSVGANVRELTYCGGVNSENYFVLGGAVCAYTELTLYKPDFPILGVEFEVRIGMDVGGTMMYIPLGLFTAQKPESDGENTDVTLYDRMARFEKVYTTELSYPAKAVDVAAEICGLCNVPLVSFRSDVWIADRPTGYTCREMLMYISQLLGGFARINRAGSLEFGWYQATGYNLKPARYWTPFERSENDFVLDKITVVTGKTTTEDNSSSLITVEAGEGAKGIEFENPWYTQQVVTDVFRKTGGFTFRAGSVQGLGDPRIDPGDVITITDTDGTVYTVPVMTLELEFDGGLSMTIAAAGNEEQPDEFQVKGPSGQDVNRLTTRLMIAEKVLAGKADINTLTANYATIQSLNAVNASVENLSADYAEAKTAYVGRLEAAEADIVTLSTNYADLANAHVSVLEADLASVKTLLFGNTAGTSAQVLQITSENATFDTAFLRQLIAQNISVSELKAGTIYTDKQKIMSPDGALQIQGSVMQFKDKDDTVRIQIGKDGTGAYSFTIFNAAGTPVWYEDGVTADAIPDNIIVDDMVAEAEGEYTGISASKLNIQSVIGAVNSEGGLRSSSITMDESEQTLTAAFSTMRQSVTSVANNVHNLERNVDTANVMAGMASSTANAASETAQNAQKTASEALKVLKGISTLDALGVVLSNDAHVIHTLTDGSGGDYTNARSTISVLLGDSDVTGLSAISATPSAGVSGSYDALSYTYQVTGMSQDNGYVDFDALYGTSDHYLTARSGAKLTTRSGNALVIPSGGSHIRKRFSLSKARDGKIGLSYDLQVSANVIVRNVGEETVAFAPETIVCEALQNDNGTIGAWSGLFVIEESNDSAVYTEKYRSAAPEAQVIYTPSQSTELMQIRITLLDPTGTYTYDYQTVSVVADADALKAETDALKEDVDQVREALVSYDSHVSELQSSVDGFSATVTDFQSAIKGLTDGNLVVNWKHKDNGDGTATVQCYVYSAGHDIADSFPANWFRYIRRTEDGQTVVGTGKTITVDLDEYIYGGTLEGQFTTYEEYNFVTRSGARLTTRGGNALTIYKEAV